MSVAGGAPAAAFHMGGDEVHMGCWNSSGEIVSFLRKELGRPSRHRADFLALWGFFQRRATAALDAALAAVAADAPADVADVAVGEATEPDNALWDDGASADLFEAPPPPPDERRTLPVILWTSELTSPAIIRQYLDPHRLANLHFPPKNFYHNA